MERHAVHVNLFATQWRGACELDRIGGDPPDERGSPASRAAVGLVDVAVARGIGGSPARIFPERRREGKIRLACAIRARGRRTRAPLDNSRAATTRAASRAPPRVAGPRSDSHVHSTLRAVGAGAVAANPLLRPIVSTPAALISLKAASALGTVYLVERLRKRNPTAAFAFALGVNSLYTIAVVHNYRVGTRMVRRQRLVQ